MTFPEEMETIQECSEKSGVSASSAVVEVITRASKEGRVINGMQKCANKLQSHPDTIMLCVLPSDDAHSDVAINIEHTLIEAYCWENGIRVLKVDCSKKLEMIVLDSKSVSDDSLMSDFSCLLILFPNEGDQMKDWKIIDMFYKKVLKQGVSHSHVICLPG